MLKNQLKDRLEIRNVTEEHLDQCNELIKYVFQVTNTEIRDLDEEFWVEQKRPILRSCTTIGWFDQDKLVSQIMVYPFMVNIHGTPYEMGGVTGVGTYPEYAGFGLIQALIKKSLTIMKEKGQTISYLYPYSIPFYRKKGWEIISDMIDYQIKDTQLPKMYEVSGRMIRADFTHPDLQQVYATFAEQTNGAMLRNSIAWNERFRWEKDELSVAIYYNAEDQPTGYLYYRVEDETFYVAEKVYLDEDARQGLWNFIRAHISMVYAVKGKIFTNEPIAFLLEDGEIEQKISPYYMGRIVDVKGFLERFPFIRTNCSEIILHIEDPLLDWNNGTFVLTWDEENRIQITNEAKEGGISLTIQTLTTMMMSYKRPTYLYKIKRLHGSIEAVGWLEKMIPNETPWFADYF
ncbi:MULTISPECIES: GNAT family N-acetyltransferase [Brevibacillus]|uniref:GNAT family N-acetyltransferase n=1 Tax=Brevibacillus TaxID=55080 RepID=UPI000B9B71DC|nr:MULTISPECIES: GNAT family N-acetyltransferase [Brevibacillus]RFB38409.1 GNAT family N-acetyltransferase [Brevibacillus sp. VP]